MLFNSFVFIIFHFLFCALYWSSPSQTIRKMILLLASMIFYAWFIPPFLLLLIASIVINYFFARQIAKTRSRRVLTLAITCNLTNLGWFKYSGFVADSINQLVGTEILDKPSIWLPLGISFYTFQIIAYLVDLYKDRVQWNGSVLSFAVFISFYGQLVAGPIVRAKTLIPQLTVKRLFDGNTMIAGLFMILMGLAIKICVADILAQFVDYSFANTGTIETSMAWLSIYAFAFQILSDFWGYSTIAIGVGLMYGITLPKNFNLPYAASSIQDFWRRWHITLSSWLRDYLYVPLGGNRTKIGRNIMITMALGGLWHGANWTFIIWGVAHGVWLVIERWMPHLEFTGSSWIKKILVFHGVCVLWVFFRAVDLSNAFSYFKALFLPPYTVQPDIPQTLLFTLVIFMVTMPWLNKLCDRDTIVVLGLKKQIAYFMVFFLLILGYAEAKLDFIYFVF